MKRLKLERYCLLIVSVIALLAFAFSLGNIHLTRQEIDLNTGRLKTSWLGVFSRTEETWMSKLIGTSSEANWQTINSTSFFNSSSPHYIYHSANNQVLLLDDLLKLKSFSEPAKKNLATSTVTLWKAGKGDSAVNAYIRELWRRFLNDGKPEITEEDLPNPMDFIE